MREKVNRTREDNYGSESAFNLQFKMSPLKKCAPGEGPFPHTYVTRRFKRAVNWILETIKGRKKSNAFSNNLKSNLVTVILQSVYR